MPYDNTNSGALFPNDRKQTDKHPDFRGSINVNGQDFWISGWKKTGQKGPFVSLSIQPKDQQQRQPATAASYRAAKSGDAPPPWIDAPPPASEDEYGTDPFGDFR